MSQATILVVEDEFLIRSLMVETLLDEGYECLEADSSDAALKIAADGLAFDLLVTDLGLPGRLDGHGLALQLRQARPGLRVIIASGRDGTVDASDPSQAWLAKPFEMQALVKAVRQMLPPD